jgi:hypothetical protein
LPRSHLFLPTLPQVMLKRSCRLVSGRCRFRSKFL